MRRILAVLVGAAVALLGGAILGEQSFTGVAGAAMGALLGFFVAEAVVMTGGERGAFAAALSAALAAAGTALAVAISTERFHDRPDPIPGGGWTAFATAALAAAITARTRRRTADDSRPGP